ncbi:Clec16a [Symbiodinium sp. CCMP2456]|nr:Clec16a [Symbiodinium sp. CCMP2456]
MARLVPVLLPACTAVGSVHPKMLDRRLEEAVDHNSDSWLSVEALAHSIVPEELVKEILFDSVMQEDYRHLMPGLDLNSKDMTAQMLSWQTPSLAWGQRLPGEVRDHMEAVQRRACEKCASPGCCEPQRWCWWLHERLTKLIDETGKQVNLYYDLQNRKYEKLQDAAFFWGSPMLLPPFLAALRIHEDVSRFLAFLFSRHASSPTLHRCLDTKWGAVLRSGYVTMVENQEELSKQVAKIFWEIGATSRFTNFRWITTSEQMMPVREGWQLIFNGFIAMRRSLGFLRLTRHRLGLLRPQHVDSDSDHLLPKEGGEYDTWELRRSLFQDDRKFTDKMVLRFLIRKVFVADDTVGDFGAFKGSYAAWLNDTGLVQVMAYDGIANVTSVTGGIVQHQNLGQPFDLGRRFDWVMSLEVGEHLPSTAASTFLSNIRRHAVKGAVISWGTPDFPSVHHPNLLTEEESTRLIERHGFQQQKDLTRQLRSAAELEWLKQTIAVYHTKAWSDDERQDSIPKKMNRWLLVASEN